MNRNQKTKGNLICGLVVASVVLGAGRGARGDFVFGTPENLGPQVNSTYSDYVGFVSQDGLELYFGSGRPPGSEYPDDMWVTKRPTREDDWGMPINLGPPLNSSHHEEPQCISADGLELYIDSTRPGGSGGEDLWVAKRDSKEDTWETPINLGPIVNSPTHDYGAWISADGLELHYNSTRDGGFGTHDLYVTRRATKDDEWGMPINLGAEVNGSASDVYPTISDNGLWLLFSDHPEGAPRSGGFGGGDIWMSTRATIHDPWGEPFNLGPVVNGPAWDGIPRISHDGSRLYLTSTRSGGFGGDWGDIYQTPIIPIVDLNGDSKVDSDDVSILIDHWQTSDPRCDIGPTPFGDGIVDIQDLKVLSEHLEPGFGRIAHWKLDETEGDIAYDSVGSDRANVHGSAVWQPDSGMMGGALALDGIDDYIAPMLILNPVNRPFRIFAWVKGGAPGQVIASQTPDEFRPGYTYLAADSSDGTLVTKMIFPQMPLKSDAVITDGEWHEVGLEWDGEHRHVYMDEEEVAVDEVVLPTIFDDTGWLNIGTGKDTEPGSFWSGLIDDVRIYEQGVKP